MLDPASLIVKIVEVLGEPHRSGSSEFTWCCPLCVKRGQTRPDTRYRLYVNPHKNMHRGKPSHTGFYFCQNCQAAGTVESLLKKLGVRVELNIQDWTSVLSTLATIGDPRKKSESADDETAEGVGYPSATYRVEEGMQSWKYLRSRGFTGSLINELKLVVGSGRWRHRIFFPNFDADGRMDFWSARAFGPEGGPKYLTSPGAPRRERLYRYHQIRRRVRAGSCKSVMIAEGAISAVMAGSNAVAAYGKYVTPEQQAMLLDLRKVAPGPLEFVIALDGDAIDFSIRLAHALHLRGADVSIVQMPVEHDPASMPRDEWEALREHPIHYDGLLTGVKLSLCSIA